MVDKTATKLTIIVDTENITSSKFVDWTPFLSDKHLEFVNILAILVGKEPTVRSRWKAELNDLFGEIVVHEFKSRRIEKNASDVLVAFAVGINGCKLDTNQSMAIISNDILILQLIEYLSISRLWVLENSFTTKLSITNKNIFLLPQITLSKAQVVEPLLKLPGWFQDSITISRTKFIVRKVPNNKQIPTLYELSFPDVDEFYLSNSRSTDSHEYELAYWDSPKKIEKLYSPHVRIWYEGLPRSSWYLSSMKGFRRQKGVEINDQLVSSQSPSHKLISGDRIRVGSFHFVFSEEKEWQIATLEDPLVIVEQVEHILKKYVDLLSIRSQTEFGQPNDIYVRDLINIIVQEWKNNNAIEMKCIFSSATKMKKELGKFNSIRNIVFHPSKGQLPFADRLRLSKLYLLLSEGLKFN